MSAEHTQLLASLEQLQAQLKATQPLDAEVAERIQAIVHDIELTLAVLPKPRKLEPTLTARLREATLDFEASHPNLSGTLGGVMDALAQMGI